MDYTNRLRIIYLYIIQRKKYFKFRNDSVQKNFDINNKRYLLDVDLKYYNFFQFFFSLI